MDGCRWWATIVLTALTVGVGSSAAKAQSSGPTLSQFQHVAPHTGQHAAPPRPVAWEEPAPPDYGVSTPLEERIVELEEALAGIRRAEDEARRREAGRPSVSVGGRMHLDWALFGQGEASRETFGNQRDAVGFRRTRLGALGEAFHVFNYRVEMDFAATDTGTNEDGSTFISQSTAFRDVFFGVTELPVVGNLRVGHFKEPFSLEQLISSNNITLMERSLNDAAFVPGRSVGAMIFDTAADERVTWAIGAFRTKLDNADRPPFRRNDGGGTSLTMRGTWLPWYDEPTEGRGLLHLGLGYSYRDVDDGQIRFRARPETAWSDRFVDTQNILNTRAYQLFGTEAAFVYGPFSVQTEWFGTWVDRSAAADAQFNGYYVYVSYFLTGEHRRYRKSAGAFDRIVPYENFFRVRDGRGAIQTGRGAWELAYRHSYIDLVDGLIEGGHLSDHTLGLNWYMSPYARMMWNYVHTYGTPDLVASADMNIFQMRVQFDF